MKKVSVLIPVYNNEIYLARFLKSIEVQTYENIEFIAVNDGSTDNSLSILKAYEKSHQNFKVISQENKGVNESKRVALHYSDGDYIVVIDSDDYISPNYINDLVSQLERTESNIVNPRYAVKFGIPIVNRFRFYAKKREDRAYDLSLEKNILTTVNVTHCKLYKREFYNLTDKSFKINEDLVTTYYNCALANRISFSNDAIYYYTPNENGLVSTHLSGFGTNKVKNFVYPLEELVSVFKKNKDLYDKYKEEIDGIIIKNYMEHINNVILRMTPSKEKQQMIHILLSLLTTQSPDWTHNKYYLENFKDIELTDYFRALFFKVYSIFNENSIEKVDDIDNLINKYDEQILRYKNRQSML